MKRSVQKSSRRAVQRGTSAAREKSSSPVSPSNATVSQSQIFDISQDAIFFWREPGGIELWNRGATELYGYTAKEAVGRVSHELLQTQFPVPFAVIKAELQSRGTWTGELRHRTSSGQEVVVSSRFQVISGPGEGMRVLESTRDVTDAKRNEAQVKRQLREQAILARFSLDALEASNIQTICDDATFLLHRELDVDFSSVFELFPDDKTLLLRSGAGWRPGFVGTIRIEVGQQTAVGRALQLNQPTVIEDVRTDRQLHLPQFMDDHNIASSIAVVIQGRGHAFGVLSVDTSEVRLFSADDVHFLESISNVLATAISRIQFERELRDTTARLRAIVDTAVDGIITITEQGIVETMNPAAERMFGYVADDVVGKNISALMPEPYRSEHDGYLGRYRRTGERRIIGIGREVRGRRKDGSEFPMELAVSETNLGKRRLFTGLVRDITARKRLEQELLEISDREQRRIGSDLHDDLCQRLAGIRFACDILRKTAGTAPVAAVITQLDCIGRDLSEAIDRARTIARGVAPISMEDNGLVAALEELTHNVNRLFGCTCSFRNNRNVVVRNPIAATHLYRIAQEGINNSLKHAAPSRVVVTLEPNEKNKVALIIKDNGAGFVVADARQSSQGMGLRTMVYRAGMIGADVQVYSAPGKGTEIVCTFSSDL